MSFLVLALKEGLRSEMTHPCQAETGYSHRGGRRLGLGLLACCSGQAQPWSWRQRGLTPRTQWWSWVEDLHSFPPLACNCSYPLRDQERGRQGPGLFPHPPPWLFCRKGGPAPPRQCGFSELHVWLCEASGFQILFGPRVLCSKHGTWAPISSRQPSEVCVGLL